MALAAAPGIPALAQVQNRNLGEDTLSHTDRTFFQKVAEGSTNEVALSQLAPDHSANAQVKSFAEMIINDRTRLNSQLSSIAGQQGVDLGPYIQKGQRDHVDSLQQKNGTEFDQAYLDQLIKSDRETAELFEREAADSKDPELGSFAAHNIGVVLEHLRHAKALEQTITGGQSE